MRAAVSVANFTSNSGDRNVRHLFTQATKRKNKQTYKINTTDIFDDAVYIMMLLTVKQCRSCRFDGGVAKA
jgi:hypothetical protein